MRSTNVLLGCQANYSVIRVLCFNYLSLLLIVTFRALNNILSSPFISSLTFTPLSILYYKKNRIYFFRIPVLNLFYFWEILNFSVLLLLALVKLSVIHKKLYTWISTLNNKLFTMQNLCFYSFFPACLPNCDLPVSALFCFHIVNSNSIYILFCKLNYIIYDLMKRWS